MNKTTGKRPRNKDLRELILETALHLFTDRGYFNTSVHDIRREADISIGSIYNYFKSKEEIAKAIYDDLLQQETEAMKQIFELHASAHDRCKAIMEHLFTMTETNPEAMGFMLNAKHREFMPSALPICSSKPLAMMRQAVKEGIANGEIRDMEVTLATSCLFGAMFRMINIRLDGAVTSPLPPHLDTVWECSWRGIAK